MPASCQKTSALYLQIDDEVETKLPLHFVQKPKKFLNTCLITNELHIKPKLILVLLIFLFFCYCYFFLHFFTHLAAVCRL